MTRTLSNIIYDTFIMSRFGSNNLLQELDNAINNSPSNNNNNTSKITNRQF
jgi:hypothetical protein